MSSEDLHQFEQSLNTFNRYLKEVIQLTETCQQLVIQLKENPIVKEELALLKPADEVDQLVSPILLRQDHAEAKENVNKRTSYIKNELKSIDDQVQSLETKQGDNEENLIKLQQQFQAQQGNK